MNFELESPDSKFEHEGVLCWCAIRSDDVKLMLTRGRAMTSDNEERRIGRGSAMFYFYPDDVVGLYDVMKAKGYDVGGTRVTFYRMEEFELKDPDGHTF